MAEIDLFEVGVPKGKRNAWMLGRFIMRLPVLPTVYVASPGRGSAPHTDVRWLIKILASASLFESLFAFAFVGLNKSSMFTARRKLARHGW